MSTKTTLKRIALVAVSALGFGVISVIPAKATVTAMSLRYSSMTVVENGSDFATFVIRTTNSSGVATKLSGSQTISVATTFTPNQVDSSTKASALTFSLVTSDGSSAASDATLPIDAASVVESDDPFTSTAADGAGTYYLKVVLPANAADAGFYTFRLTYDDGTSVVQRASATVKLVTSVSDLTDATVAVTTAASNTTTGDSYGQDANTVTSVAVTNGNGGLVVSSGLTTLAPTVRFRTTADCATPDTVTDNGGGSAAAFTDVTKWDGNFSIKFNTSTITSSCESTTSTIRAIFLGSGVSNSKTVAVSAKASGYAYTYVTATGAAKQNSAHSAYIADYWVPLTTTSATVALDLTSANDLTTGTAVTGAKVNYYVEWSSQCVTADVSPKANTLTQLTTDASGEVVVTLTQVNPIDDCQATVTFSNVTAMTTHGDLTRVLKWDAPRAVLATASPTGDYQALLKSTNTITWTITDQYAKPVVGKTARLTMTGKNAPTAGIASKTTDANGQISHTWTDSLAVADGTESVQVDSVGGDTLTGSDRGIRTITFKSTLSAVAKLYATYAATTAMGTPTLVPSTNIGGSAGRTFTDADQLDLAGGANTGLTANNAWLAFQFVARTAADVDVTGVPTTVTIDNGFLLNPATGKAVKSLTLYANDAFYAVGYKTGVATITATNGTVTSSAKINWINSSGDARVLSATEKDGTITATVKDFAGNTVAGVDIDVSLSAGSLGNGASFAKYTTDANGSVAFTVTGAATVTLKLTSAAKSVNAADAGDALGTVVTPGSPAGVRSVSVTTTGTVDAAKVAADAATAAAKAAQDAAVAEAAKATAAAKAAQDAAVAAAEKAAADAVAAAKAAGEAAVAAAKAAQDAAVAEAQASADAAAEAIDAANAATDAANLAAEAADAATVAAEEARDAADAATAAVEELSTQVATLMAALKAQITTLANTVAKIAKKVRA